MTSVRNRRTSAVFSCGVVVIVWSIPTPHSRLGITAVAATLSLESEHDKYNLYYTIVARISISQYGKFSYTIAGTESDGHRVPDPKRVRALRMRVGMVFQQFNLFPHMTVLENLIEAPVQVQGVPRQQAEANARALLGKVHLHNLSHRQPGDLSGGEQQRVAIARTLAMNPDCVLIDEPTSALDPEMVGEVLRVLRELADEGMTLLIVTHEMDFARSVADKVVMLDRGEVVESGEPQSFFAQPGTERARNFLKRLLQR